MSEETKEQVNMQISFLGSGSSGNSTYVETDQCKILIDAGLSGKQTEERLNSLGKTLQDLDAIFISHEHSDHTKGVGVLARRYGALVYANSDTWKEMDKKYAYKKTTIPHEQRMILDPGEQMTLGDMDIISFPVSHDSINNQFYTFRIHNKQFTMMTDLGYVSERIQEAMKNSDAYLMESNYDVDMLRYGKDPWFLKQRVLSDVGHLSNEDAAEALANMIGDKTKAIYLGHISKRNNFKRLALETHTEILQKEGFDIGGKIKLEATDAKKPTDLLIL